MISSFTTSYKSKSNGVGDHFSLFIQFITQYINWSNVNIPDDHYTSPRHINKDQHGWTLPSSYGAHVAHKFHGVMLNVNIILKSLLKEWTKPVEKSKLLNQGITIKSKSEKKVGFEHALHKNKVLFSNTRIQFNVNGNFYLFASFGT